MLNLVLIHWLAVMLPFSGMNDELRVCVLLHLIYQSMYTTDKVPSAI